MEKIAVMYLGEIVEIGPAERILENPEHDIQTPPNGCRFHTRCPEAREACASESPTLGGPESGTHRISCFRSDATHEYWDDGFLDADGEIDIPGHESD